MQSSRILFRHIAKTGGTTLLNHFRTELGPEAMCVLGPHSRCKRFFSGLPQIEELDASQRDQFRVVQGHGVSDAAVTLMQDAEMCLMVVLREPVALVRSRYNHRFNTGPRKDLNVSPDFFMRKLASDSMANSLVDSFPSLVDPKAESLFDQACSVLRKFDYVFTTEGMSTQLLPMLRAYGMSEVMERKRVAEHKESLPVSDEDIRAINDVDLALYDMFVRPVVSDGHSHNALGFDAAAKRAAFEAILTNAATDPEVMKAHCYTELADALCRELRGTAALALLDAGKAPVADADAFRPVLEAQWSDKVSGLSADGQARAEFLARQLGRKLAPKGKAGKKDQAKL